MKSYSNKKHLVPPIIFLQLIFSISIIFNSFHHSAFADQVAADDNFTAANDNYLPVIAVETAGNENVFSHEIDKTVPIQHDCSLTIKRTGSGSGIVTGRDIDCGTICSGVFPQGTEIELTADPDAGSIFAGWSGGDCGVTAPCTVTMDAVAEISAQFIKTYTIRAIVNANGAITSLDTATESEASNQDLTITVLAVTKGATRSFEINPKSGYHVVALHVDGIPVNIATIYTFAHVTSDHTITATIALDAYAVTASNNGNNAQFHSGEMNPVQP